MKSLRPVLALLLVAFCGSGCSLTIQSNPNAYPFPTDEIPPLASGLEVAVANGYDAPQTVEVDSRVYIDLQQHTATALQIVTREFGNLGVRVAPTAAKSMTLWIERPVWTTGMWTMKGEVDLRADLGNGEQLVHKGQAQTGGNAMRVFNASILRATSALMKDPQLKAYLEGQ